MLNRPLTWVVLVIMAAAAVATSARYFDRAFPLVALELELDRRGALERATALAESQGWPTAGWRQAASFDQRDEELKRYIELEAGGPGAWNRLVESGDHHAYQWRVRQYREAEATEVEVRFAADGTPWGFVLKLPEDAPGAVLGRDGARWIAETAAVEDWGVDLGSYAFVEGRQELRPGGRMDHWFVYERPDMGYGEARFRLRIGVAGDTPSEVTRFVEVPEAFQRRHSEMRSANNLIALIAGVSSSVLYLVIGGGVGAILLLRRRWLLWRHALAWGAAVGVLMMAATLNQLPLEWMDYDTAVSRSGFLGTQILGAAAIGLGMTLFVAFVIMAGESLSRRAFPNHVQLWRSWSPGVANARPVLGLTLGGYVFAAFFIAYAVSFYLFADGVLGWPVSGESLLHPDILATPFPWLSAVAISLMAGVSEEAMYRAIPLAAAALIAARFGRRGMWLAIALVVQALIFAAAHANYPQQPAYARVVELLIPSIALGLVFLRWGLVPAVIAHFAYNMVWFSIPVFASSAPGTWLNQTLLVLLGLLPLGVVLAARFRHGPAPAVPAYAYNGAWRPEPAAEVEPEPATAGAGAPAAAAGAPGRLPAGGTGLPGWALRWAPALGLAGLMAWAAATEFRPAPAPLDARSVEAVAAARAALVERGLIDASPEAGWRLLPSTHVARTAEHRFVWQTAGPDAYGALVGTHLADPHWHVRAARFQGELDERAEELLVEVDAAGAVYRIRHTLPEERPGPSLAESEARARALAAAEAEWGLGRDALRPVSAEASQRPERVDWTFTFATPATAALPEGEARARVVVAGDRVTDATRFVHIPEQWERDRRAERTRSTIISGISLTILILLAVAAIVVSAGRLGKGRLSLVTTGVGMVAGVLLIGIGMANGWPSMIAHFSTAEPYRHQVIGFLVAFSFMATVGGALAGLLLALAHAWAGEVRQGWHAGAGALARTGIPAGAVAAGVLAVAAALAPGGPPWAAYPGADAFLPVLGALLSPLQDLFLYTLFTLLALGAVARAPARGRWGLPARALLAVGIGVILGNGAAGEAILPWLAASALATGLVLAGVRLLQDAGFAVVPLITGVMVILGQLATIMHGPFPGARIGVVAGCVLVAVAAVLWSRFLPGPAAAPSPAPVGRETVAA